MYNVNLKSQNDKKLTHVKNVNIAKHCQKMVKIGEKKNWPKFSKLSKIVNIVKNCPHCKKLSKMNQDVQIKNKSYYIPNTYPLLYDYDSSVQFDPILLNATFHPFYHYYVTICLIPSK